MGWIVEEREDECSYFASYLYFTSALVILCLFLLILLFDLLFIFAVLIDWLICLWTYAFTIQGGYNWIPINYPPEKRFLRR